MNPQLAAFAVTNKSAHVAVVEHTAARRAYSFRETEKQLESVIEKIYPLEYKIKLVSGAYIHFILSAQYKRMLGLRLDRIQTTIQAIRDVPDYFLESRLAPGVTPEQGISLSAGE